MLLKQVSSFFLLLLVNNSLAQDAAFKNLCDDAAYSDICVSLGNKYYLIDGNAKTNWHDAERMCRRQNGILVTIQSANELSLISDFLEAKNYGGKRFWSGVNDLGSEGIFYSIETGNLMPFAKWIPGQPDNVGGHENCVQLWKFRSAFEMNDANCDLKIHYICELKEKPNGNIHPKCGVQICI